MDQLSEESRVELEQHYVRDCYEKIADEFDLTRHSKWPKVERFLQHLTQPSLLLDVGCGNGKYLDVVSPFSIGCDVSSNLLLKCKEKGFEVVRCDMMRLPFCQDRFDAIICIASLHHVVTSKRRQCCLEDICRLLLQKTGKLLLQVWAYEQPRKDNPYLKRNQTSTETDDGKNSKSIGDQIIIPIHKNRTPFRTKDMLVPFNKRKDGAGESSEQHLRYYHLFEEKELENMFEKISSVEIIESYNDKGNWLVSVVRTAANSQ